LKWLFLLYLNLSCCRHLHSIFSWFLDNKTVMAGNTKLIDNVRNFMHTIRQYPTSTIEKSTLIQLIDNLIKENPELDDIYDVISPFQLTSEISNVHTNGQILSKIHSDDFSNNKFIEPHHSMTPLIVQRQESIISSTHTESIKDGELIIKKASSFLSSVLKKKSTKLNVFGKIIVINNENTKLGRLEIYESKKSQKLLHSFNLDKNCSASRYDKKEFTLQHPSGMETFIVESGSVDSWIKSINETSSWQQQNFEETYMIPDITPRPSAPVDDIPVRPPPRLPQSIVRVDSPLPLPDNVYVCLYNNYPTMHDSNELEFNCGDLLYIVNSDGLNFYVGYKIMPSMNKHNQDRMGLVFKGYITPAYERIW